jgi:phosphomannomutase
MPELSRFYGIVIRMFFDDHNPPHFHARYGGEEVVIGISTLAAIAGHLPPRAMGLVIEWASMHQDELMREWEKARDFQSLGKIDPLP